MPNYGVTMAKVAFTTRPPILLWTLQRVSHSFYQTIYFFFFVARARLAAVMITSKLSSIALGGESSTPNSEHPDVLFFKLEYKKPNLERFEQPICHSSKVAAKIMETLGI